MVLSGFPLGVVIVCVGAGYSEHVRVLVAVRGRLVAVLAQAVADSWCVWVTEAGMGVVLFAELFRAASAPWGSFGIPGSGYMGVWSRDDGVCGGQDWLELVGVFGLGRLA